VFYFLNIAGLKELHGFGKRIAVPLAELSAAESRELKAESGGGG